ncbi:MAG TPA: WbqC family protein, partial [Tenuifilaceae bacterium]|nr:WbqC family protein [Tenuifilaceae bacterium]
MQPYFFPYIGYFSLIKHTDEFILLDTVQFIRHGWIERNRILKPSDGWQYI